LKTSSQIFPPAQPSEIEAVESLYHIVFPQDLRAFYLSSNGAALFRYQHRLGWHTRCHLLSTSEMITEYHESRRINTDLYEIHAHDDLMYLPIGLVDQDFITLSCNPDFPDELFYMRVEFRWPYTEQTRRNRYEHGRKIYPLTFSQWLNLVISTNGLKGLGDPDE
jgi:hypothetical protein